MRNRSTSLTGFVLAGGEGRRMGGPKRGLVFGDETMLERQVRQLRSVCRRVIVVGTAPTGRMNDVPHIPDRIPAHGPLGGILTALEVTGSELNLIVACDLPFVHPRFLNFLADRARMLEGDVTVPEDRSRRCNPLCGVYRRGLRGMIRNRVARDANKADGYFPYVRLRVVTWREIMGAGFSSHTFDNINLPDDFEEAIRRLRPASMDAAKSEPARQGGEP